MVVLLAAWMGPLQGLGAVDPSSGPYAGGNTITITNESFGNITNVLIGGVQATITGQGAEWVTLTVPELGSAGAKDIVIQTSDAGDTTLAGAYTVNPAGQIGSSVLLSACPISGGARLCVGAEVERHDRGLG